MHALKHWIGLDRAIAFTVVARFWSAAAGIVTVLLIARFLTPSEQGYYYTFYSLVALQIVFELGFSFVILQLAAHERAQVTFLPGGRIEGDEISHSRLASVLQKAVRWYSVAGLLMAAALLPAGFYFFGAHRTAGAPVAWIFPWCLLVLAAMLAFQIDPVFSFLEGCGYITQVARRRLVQAVVGSLLAWAALATHHGLYSPAMVILGQVAVGLAYLFSPNLYKLLHGLLFYPVGEHSVGWRTEIWPFQWKIAISWLCGYFIFQLFNPVLFAYQGPVQAGRMGMSLSISTAIGSIAIAWMNTKASPFGAMVARGQFEELDKLFFRTLWQSTALLVVGATAFFGALILAEHSFPKLAMRVLTPWALALLLLGTIMNHIVTSEALYLRAHKQEPFLPQAVISAVLIGFLTFFLGKNFGANAVVVGLVAQGVLFGLPYGTYIFVTKRRAWHNARSEAAAWRLESEKK
ncbi:MAG: hypothetical protein P4L40_09540 [Terracidiphilus sp.]|nr:hypothetical protein [Terracidiphilus sp.]